MELVRIDLKKCKLPEDLANDRPECRTRIPVAYPNIVGAKALIMILMRGLNSLVGCCGN